MSFELKVYVQVDDSRLTPSNPSSSWPVPFKKSCTFLCELIILYVFKMPDKVQFNNNLV